MTTNAQTSRQKNENAGLMKAATYAAVGVASSLVILKFFAWIHTDSISLLSTLIDSLLDIGASLINLIAVRHALQPADDDHRFGHGKAEPLAGLMQAAFISGSAMFLLIQAGERLFNPHIVENTNIGYVVMVVSIILTLGLVMFQKYVVNKSGSLAISADSMHYRMDILVNFSVIVSLFLGVQFGWLLADPLFAIAISVYILRGAWEIGQQSMNLLMDRELPDEDREKIIALANSEQGVQGLHDLRTRSSGQDVFIQLHLELDPEMKLREAHTISENVMHKIENAFPNAEVLIHEDPEDIVERQNVFS